MLSCCTRVRGRWRVSRWVRAAPRPSGCSCGATELCSCPSTWSPGFPSCQRGKGFPGGAQGGCFTEMNIDARARKGCFLAAWVREGSRSEDQTLAVQRWLRGFESDRKHLLYAEIPKEQNSSAPLTAREDGGSCRAAGDRGGSGGGLRGLEEAKQGNKNFGYIKSHNIHLIKHTNSVI